MTEKLYENDSYLMEFEAVVLSCEPCGEYFDVVLDKTAFFPEGGGQLSDTGKINDFEVVDVQIKDGIVHHKTAGQLNIGETVTGNVDWDIRFPRMQNHSGEHIVSGLIYTKYSYSNVGFHLGKNEMTLDVNGKLTESDIEIIEAAANEVVYSNSRITVSYPTIDELRTMQYRSKIDIADDIRIITIEGCDCCACCAPHVSRTGEIGLIKILNFYPNKGGTRIELICGKDALNDYRMLHKNNRSIMQALSAKRGETVEAVERIFDSLSSMKNENKALKEKLAFAELEITDINDSIYAFSGEATYDEMRYCSNIIQNRCEKLCLIFSECSENEYLYVVSSKSMNVRAFVTELNKNLNGRGGGRDCYAQGKVMVPKQQIITFLESVL